MFHYHMYYYPWYWSVLSWLISISFWAILIFVIAKLFISFNHPKSETDEPTALNILKQRYAKGEIDEKEFEKIKKQIT